MNFNSKVVLILFGSSTMTTATMSEPKVLPKYERTLQLLSDNCSGPNTVLTGDKCYSFFVGALSWNAAKASCEAYGLNLASIESEDESDDLMSLIARAEYNSCSVYSWVGLRSSITESGPTKGTWSWLGTNPEDSTLVSYTNWRLGQDTAEKPAPACGGYYRQGSYQTNWYAASCSTEYCWACMDNPMSSIDAVTATLFSVGQVVSSGAWQVGTTESNTVIVPFELQGYSALDADFIAAMDSVGCPEGTITTTPFEDTPLSDINSQLSITFVNEQFAATQNYCVRVKLMFGTQTDPIASSMIQFTATSLTSGIVRVTYKLDNEDLQIKVNEVVPDQTINSTVDSYIPTIIIKSSVTSDGPIYLGESITVGVEKGPLEVDNFDLVIQDTDLVGVTNFDAEDDVCTFKIPIRYFDDFTVTFSLGVSWTLASRRLGQNVQENVRHLQDTRSGRETIPVTFDLVPVDVSGGYKLAMIPGTLIAIGGIVLDMK